MRLLLLYLALLSVAAGFTLYGNDGIPMDLGDESRVIDGSTVTVAERDPVVESNVHGTLDATEFNTADYDHSSANVYLYEDTNYKGRRARAYLCSMGGMNHCLADGAAKPWASSFNLQTCPDGAADHGRGFRCFFFSTPICNYTSGKYLYTRESITDLSKNGFDDKIKALECHYDPPPT